MENGSEHSHTPNQVWMALARLAVLTSEGEAMVRKRVCDTTFTNSWEPVKDNSRTLACGRPSHAVVRLRGRMSGCGNSEKRLNVTLDTALCDRRHSADFLNFGQSAPKGRIMLCTGIPERIYESLKTLCCLANAGGPLQAHEIALAANLPPAQTAKILQLMTWAGFVESRRGTNGGFWLVRPAELIRVTDVTDFFAHQTQGRPAPKRDGLLKALQGAMARCHKEFARITVADLAKVCECEPTGPSRARSSVSTRHRRSPAPSKSAA